MAADSGIKFDGSEWTEALNKLDGPFKEKLARSMAVAGGTLLRDEAKHYAPVDTGTLRDSIYLAFKDNKSNEQQIVYSVSWNSRTAPHGHLIEFGTYKMAAKPFLRPAYDAAPRAQVAMIARGRERAAELLAEIDSGA
jgi:HK97 gp10 family phage protein